MLVLGLALAAPLTLHRSDRPFPVLDRVVEEASFQGAPIRGAAVVRTPRSTFGSWPTLEGPLHPVIGPEQAEAVALARFPGRVVAPPRRVWSTRGDRARLAWEVLVLAPGPASWEVHVDAERGRVSRIRSLTHTARGNYYPINPILSVLDVVEVAPGLTSAFATAYSCRATDADPGVLALAACEVAEQQAWPDPRGDYLFLPRGGSSPDPFAEVQAFAHVERMSSWLSERFDLTVRWAPIDVFVNFPLNNAFFGDFDGDGIPDLSFGHSADGTDLGYDADVVYHELGHAVVGTLAPELPFLQADELGMEWVSGSINEGAADVFAMVLTGDPAVGEYAGAAFGRSAIRDLERLRRCPDDLQGEVHADGEILGSFFWRLIDDPDVGPDVAAELLVGAIPLWGAAPSWDLVGRSLETTADDMLGAGHIDEAQWATIDRWLQASGMPGCERVHTLVSDVEKGLLVPNVGLFGDLERLPGNVQLRIPAGTPPFEIEIDDGLQGDAVGWSLFVRAGAPVEHEVFHVDGLGLSAAVPRVYDRLIDGDGHERLTSDDLLPTDLDVYVTVASRNVDLPPLALAYSAIAVTLRVPGDDLGPTPRPPHGEERPVVREGTVWACATGGGSAGASPVWLLVPLLGWRRRG